MIKTLFLTLVAFGLMTVTSISPAKAEQKTCRVQTNDIGNIVGQGSTQNEAFEDASMKCFERYEAKHLRRGKGQMDEETGLTIIDLCANVKCS